MRVKSHQLPITMRTATEFAADPPPAGGRQRRLAPGFRSHSPPHGRALGTGPPPRWAGEQRSGCQLITGDGGNSGKEAWAASLGNGWRTTKYGKTRIGLLLMRY